MRCERLPTWRSPKLALRPSRMHGVGLHAVAPVHEGEIVLRWGGLLTDAAGAREANRRGLSTMQWDEDLFSVETDENDPAFCVNHLCDPNLWMLDATALAAIRPIAAGEEVCADYALWEADEDYVATWACCCGSPLCRGRVTGRDWRLGELRARYAGHCSPLIERRVARTGR